MLVCAGLDPSGGAGLTADLEALAAVGATGYAVAAALTAQGPGGGRGVAPVPPEFLLAQLDALVGAPPARSSGEVVAAPQPRPSRIGAVKTGMLATAENVAALAARLGEKPLARAPLVVDPVLFASAGMPLFDPGPLPHGEAFAPLLARAALVTPNRPELEVLADTPVESDDQAVRAARSLGARAVLVKGGHREGAPLDLLVTRRAVVTFTGRRRRGTARGTGCRLASAVAGGLALGATLEEAVRRAKRLVERYLDAAARR